MCHVLVVSNEKLSNDEQKEFQAKKRLEIKLQKSNCVIFFAYPVDKKGKRTLKRYQAKHPRAEIWQNN